MRTVNLFTAAALLLSSPCAAWPEKVDELWGMAERAITELAPRQQQQQSTTSYNLSPSLIQGNTATTITSSATATGSGSVVSGGGNNTATMTTDSGNGNSTSTSQPEFDPRLPPGGVNLITPNTALAVPTYYKIDDWVTFAWNYTSLLATPTAVDVLASCAQNQATYTIALNQSIPSSGAQTVLWDTNSYQANATIPLLTATYTLIIHDADEPITARASAGYLGVFNQYYFGMYVPQSPTPYDQYVCVTCSGAMTAAERQTIYTILGVAGITVASFTWFTGVAGLW